MAPDIYFDPALDTIENVLRHRGVVVAESSDRRQVLLPEQFESGPPRYFELWGKSSFRKMVRALLAAGSEAVGDDDLSRIGGNSAVGYVEFLEEIGVAVRTLNGVVLTRPINNIGPSLEHYVSHLCIWELGGRAKWGVRLKGLPSGGDFDVLAWLMPKPVYIELKSTRPASVTASALRQFVARHRELAPDLSVLLVDTDDDMAELIDRLNGAIEPDFMTNADVIDPLGREGVRLDYDFRRMRVQAQKGFYASVGFGYHGVYVVASRPSILTQLRRCLSHHYAYMKRVELLQAKVLYG